MQATTVTQAPTAAVIKTARATLTPMRGPLLGSVGMAGGTADEGSGVSAVVAVSA